MADNNQPDRAAGQRPYSERRRKPDWVVRSVSVITLLGWVAAMVTMAIYYKASEDATKFSLSGYFANYFKRDRSFVSSANIGLLRGAFIAMLVTLIVCVLGFILNLTRHKRKTDKYNKLLITLGSLTIFFFILFVIGNGAILFG